MVTCANWPFCHRLGFLLNRSWHQGCIHGKWSQMTPYHAISWVSGIQLRIESFVVTLEQFMIVRR